MTDFKGIRGWKVQTLSSDPVASQELGGSWASGGNLNTARGRTAGGGTQTAAITTGGSAGPSYTRQAVTEQYNGSSWTEVGDLNTARSLQGECGTYTSSIVAGSSPIATPSDFIPTGPPENLSINTSKIFLSIISSPNLSTPNLFKAIFATS